MRPEPGAESCLASALIFPGGKLGADAVFRSEFDQRRQIHTRSKGPGASRSVRIGPLVGPSSLPRGATHDGALPNTDRRRRTPWRPEGVRDLIGQAPREFMAPLTVFTAACRVERERMLRGF